jgi:hypothetical protein
VEEDMRNTFIKWLWIEIHKAITPLTHSSSRRSAYLSTDRYFVSCYPLTSSFVLFLKFLLYLSYLYLSPFFIREESELSYNFIHQMVQFLTHSCHLCKHVRTMRQKRHQQARRYNPENGTLQILSTFWWRLKCLRH